MFFARAGLTFCHHPELVVTYTKLKAMQELAGIKAKPLSKVRSTSQLDLVSQIWNRTDINTIMMILGPTECVGRLNYSMPTIQAEILA